MDNTKIWLLLFITVYCCIQNVATSNNRVVGGLNATIEEFPYMISVLYRGQHICGGAIISKDKATTAAQCVHGIPQNELTVRLGSSFRDRGGTVHNISGVQTNPLYNPKTLDHDDALFSIDDFESASPKVKAIPLSSNIPEDGSVGILPGWGRQLAGSPLSEQLKVVELPVVNFRVCQSHYKRLKGDMHFCAGLMSGLRGPCFGDTGGPFVVNGQLAGLFSFSYGCSEPNYPGVFIAPDFKPAK